MAEQNRVIEQDVKQVASLARLGLTEQELADFTADLARILEHFAAIQDIDTSDTPTSDDVTGLTNVTRPDQATPDNLCDTETLLAAAPKTAGRQFKVPAIFED